MSWHSRRSSYWDEYDFIDENPICTKRALPQNKRDDNECKLREILNSHWFSALSATIKSNPDSAEYLGPEQYRSANMIPRRSFLFRALNMHHARDWKVVIMGDHPSLKSGHCSSGIPFYDSIAVKRWCGEDSNHSIKYLLFNLLEFYGLIPSKMLNVCKYEEVERFMADFEDEHDLKAMTPWKWMKGTMMDEGVLWLNEVMTIGGSKDSEQHQRFWKPILRAILFAILGAKKNLKKRNGRKGTLLVVFNKKTKNFVLSVQAQIPNHKRTQIKIIRMKHHFALHSVNKLYFRDIRFFQRINESLEMMGMDPIQWINEDVLEKMRKMTVIKGSEDKMEKKINRNQKKQEHQEHDDIDSKAKSNKIIKETVEQKYDDDVDSDDFSC